MGFGVPEVIPDEARDDVKMQMVDLLTRRIVVLPDRRPVRPEGPLDRPCDISN
jgi:hypothetical protein